MVILGLRFELWSSAHISKRKAYPYAYWYESYFRDPIFVVTMDELHA